MTPGRAGDRFGGFRLGPLQLALPMQALREVVPMGPLQGLPCPCPAVVGGIDLRGVLVPVLDLRQMLGLPTPALASPTVIVMVHQDHILGLLADGVTDVFDTVTRAPTPVSVQDAVAAVYAGTVRRDDVDVAVNILSPAAIAAWPQVPMVADPEPERQVQAAARSPDAEMEERGDFTDRSLPMLLMRCNRLPLAIDALAVHATLATPQLEPSVLAQGACRGVISYGGQHIGAIDLPALAGLGALDPSQGLQAVVLRTPAGLVALLISDVADIVRCAADAVVPVPPFALPRPELFRGAIPLEALPADAARQHAMGIGQYLLLDADALRATMEVVGLGETNTDRASRRRAASVAEGTEARGGAALAASGRSLITFDIQTETATPIDEVQEILPFSRDVAVFESGGAVLGMMADRGRSIPVVCLSRLLLDKPVRVTPAASVLVVRADDTLVGFAVPALRAIERTDWEPEVQALAQRRADGALPDWPPRQLARVGQGETERMLPVVGLVEIARALRDRRLAA